MILKVYCSLMFIYFVLSSAVVKYNLADTVFKNESKEAGRPLSQI